MWVGSLNLLHIYMFKVYTLKIYILLMFRIKDFFIMIRVAFVCSKTFLFSLIENVSSSISHQKLCGFGSPWFRDYLFCLNSNLIKTIYRFLHYVCRHYFFHKIKHDLKGHAVQGHIKFITSHSFINQVKMNTISMT